MSNLGVSVRVHSRVSEERLREAVMQSRSSRRYGGAILNNAVQKAYRERVAAGIIKPHEEPRKPKMLVEVKSTRLVEAKQIAQAAPAKRKEPKRRRLEELPKEIRVKGKVYPKLSWIVDATARYFDVTLDDLIGSSRLLIVCRPRQIAMHLCRELTIRSTTEIGRALGGRDHTTVLHSTALIKRLLAGDPDLATKVCILRQIIMNGMYVDGNDERSAGK